MLKMLSFDTTTADAMAQQKAHEVPQPQGGCLHSHDPDPDFIHENTLILEDDELLKQYGSQNDSTSVASDDQGSGSEEGFPVLQILPDADHAHSLIRHHLVSRNLRPNPPSAFRWLPELPAGTRAFNGVPSQRTPSPSALAIL